jgi:hypothetical protein
LLKNSQYFVVGPERGHQNNQRLKNFSSVIAEERLVSHGLLVTEFNLLVARRVKETVNDHRNGANEHYPREDLVDEESQVAIDQHRAMEADTDETDDENGAE